MAAENVETLVQGQNFMELSSKEKKAYGRETETDKEKRKTFQGTEEIVEYFLGSLKRYNVIGGLSGKDFDADKIVQYSKQRKKIPKIPKIQLLPIQELIY